MKIKQKSFNCKEIKEKHASEIKVKFWNEKVKIYLDSKGDSVVLNMRHRTAMIMTLMVSY